MADAVFNVFSKAKYQVCLVHVARNIMHKVRVENRKELCEDFKSIHQAKDVEAATVALNTFCEKWGKLYKKSHTRFTRKPVFTDALSVSESDLAKYLLESFKKQIKKYTKRKEQFPNEESMERFLVKQFEDYNQRFATRCHIGFNQARAKLEEMF